MMTAEEQRLIVVDCKAVGDAMTELGMRLGLYNEIRDKYAYFVGYDYWQEMSESEKEDRIRYNSAQVLVFEENARLAYEEASMQLTKLGLKISFNFNEWLQAAKEAHPIKSELIMNSVPDYVIKAYKREQNRLNNREIYKI